MNCGNLNQQKKLLGKQKEFLLQLRKLGWEVSIEEWTEFLYLTVDRSIIKRWLFKGSEYRETILKNYNQDVFISMQKLFNRLDGKTIKQKIMHTKFFAKLIIN